MYKRVKQQVHFVGIGGIGMSGIAELLVRQGFPVSGSDIAQSDTVKRLEGLGVRVAIGHRAENLAGAKVVVISSAIDGANPEIAEAQRLKLPVVRRAEMLAELMRLRFGIAVAGTHGKTTTTSMLASIVTHAGLDPTVVVGGKVDALGGNAKLGHGKFMVAEADESDGTFLKLSPVITIVTNIDNDHLDFYGSMDQLRPAFLEFVNKVPYYGRSIVCIDDPEVRAMLPAIVRPKWTYGFDASADFQITDYKPVGMGSTFRLLRAGAELCRVEMSVPGQHNARNAVAALAAATEIDIDATTALAALKQFAGVRRRFEVKGEIPGRQVTVVDDYGHHPTEIAATLRAARECWKGRIVVAFQPHRFSRTKICWDQFLPALADADVTCLLDIYTAGEPPVRGVTSEKLAEHISREKECLYVGSLDSAVARISEVLKPGDLLLTLGAGTITQLGAKLVAGAKPGAV